MPSALITHDDPIGSPLIPDLAEMASAQAWDEGDPCARPVASIGSTGLVG